VPQRILVVEDNHDLRAMFRDALSIAGFHVTEASDGLQALRCLDNERPDLVVLDLRLPQISGVEIHDDLAANIQTRNIPIVVVSGSPHNLGDRPVECVLTKPVLPEKLVETVRQCLRIHDR
jgi:twitching motility two-component system response regulator PilH